MLSVTRLGVAGVGKYLKVLLENARQWTWRVISRYFLDMEAFEPLSSRPWDDWRDFARLNLDT